MIAVCVSAKIRETWIAMHVQLGHAMTVHERIHAIIKEMIDDEEET